MDTAHWIKIIIRGIISLVGIIGNNWLLISSLPKSISQLRTNDALFINLAISNLITNYLVDTLNIFNSEQFVDVGKLYCSFQFFLPEFSEASSILTTMFITIYWHQKLVGSLKRGGGPVLMDNIRIVILLLMASWTFSLVFNIPHFFFIADTENMTSAEDCIEELPSKEAELVYEVLFTTLANALPLAGIFYASVQIAMTLLKNEKRMKKMGATGKNERNTTAEKSGNNTGPNNVAVVGKSKTQSKPGSLLRAAKSVLAVAILFLIVWAIHFIISIIGSISSSNVIEDIESFIGAVYTSIIPYIYLYGAQKLTCCRKTERVVGPERGVNV